MADGRWVVYEGAMDPREVHDNGRPYQPLYTEGQDAASWLFENRWITYEQLMMARAAVAKTTPQK